MICSNILNIKVCQTYFIVQNIAIFVIINNPLSKLGNIPVTAAILESLFPHIKGGSQKIRQLERDGQIIRLKRGLYVCSPNITGKTLSTELLANHLYTPSYISMSSALRY